MQTLPDLAEYEITGQLRFVEKSAGYPVAQITHPKASGEIALHGAHLTAFQPAGEKPIIFTSSQAIYTEGKAIRGGIPICWPWFNAHPTESSFPSHGFARNRFWNLIASQANEEFVELTFELPTQGTEIWLPQSTRTTLRVRIGHELQLELLSENFSNEAITVSEALHSYFCVSDSSQVSVTGLDQARYIDTVGEQTERLQSGDVSFSGEVDRIYQSDATTHILDKNWNRIIKIQKSGSGSTVVWNPWNEKAADLGDLADEEYHDFICVETANAHDKSVSVPAMGKHLCSLIISAETL